MAHKTPQHSAARALARRQHWVIARFQLLVLGYSTEAIKHRIAKGRLRPLFRGVYAAGQPDTTQYGWWMAAVLACGPGAAISHTSTAALWRIRPLVRGPIEVSTSRDRCHRGIRTHRRLLMPPDLALHHNIPVTNPVCTLIDVAPGLTREELEGSVSEADKLGLIHPDELRTALDSHPGWTGVTKLRGTLDRRTYVMTDTELERRFLPIALRAGLPLPLTQTYVNGFRVDFYWPDLGLVVETDGLTYHRTSQQQAEDRVRDQTHTAAGLTALRFTHAQIRYEPGHVEEVLRAVARRLPASRPGR